MRSSALTPRKRRGLTGSLVAALVVSPLALGAASPADASVSTKIATFPYNQAWTNPDLITANDDWSGVTGVEGYLGAGLTTTTGVNPQSVVATTTDTDVVANALATANNGGVLEVQGDTIAIQGSGSANAPYVAFHLDLTGKTAASFAFNARDLDASADDAAQQIAVQYRVGGTGDFIDLPAGYIADATTANAATKVTPVEVTLPAAAHNQSSVFVRVITTNAAGNDELVGIDDIAITATGGAAALNVTNPGAQTGTVGTAITPLQINASGGTPPYDVQVTNLPAGLTYDAGTDTISGTPTTAGSTTVNISVTDGASATDSDTFTWTITEPAAPIAIAAIQGTGSATTLPSGTPVTTQGVVTGSYSTGGYNGFYIQTPGADTTPNASDAIFVYGGTSGFASYPSVGASVRVTGTPGEFANQTQLSNASWTAVADLGNVVPKTQVPGTACALPGTTCLSAAQLATAREVNESEVFKPTAPWTVTDPYDGSPDLNAEGRNDGRFLGEIAVVAESDDPLVAPTEVIDAQDKAAIEARKAYNAAHRLILDDGSAWTYSTTSHQNDPFPWFTKDHSVRVGAGITFNAPVVFTERFGSWRIFPQQQVVGVPSGLSFEQTRPQAPQPVGGDLKIATFNVLNFFPTTGVEFVASGLGTCEYYYDRDNQPTNNRSCTNNGPRGAADEANLVRQRDKIVRAINTADADIVSLEELENSVQFNKPRDFAINALVSALNADAGAGTWAAVPSAPVLPPTSEQDVIRNGFIYQPANVSLVGDSVVLSDQSSAGEAFEDAREPLAQAFKRTGTADSDAFAVIVNHFKSKGSGTADPDGQGNANDRRKLQAAGLVTFADQFKTLRGISKVFLAGDFNAYTEEDPIQILKAAGYTNLESTSDPAEESYSFDGMVGSLDHVLANNAALATVAGVDIWDINAYESVYYEYARYNTNVTNLYAPYAYRSSDHNPEIVGIKAPAAEPVVLDTTVTGTSAPVVYGKAGSVAVKVAPATATGTVTLSLGGVAIGTTALTAGAGTIAVPAKALPAGAYTLALSYAGDAGHKASTGTVSYVVTKATPTLTAKVKPRVVIKGKKRAKVVVRVEADGFTPTGKVRVRVAGRTYNATLVEGKAVVKLKKIAKPRRYKAKVAYLGDANTLVTRTTVKFRVKRR